MNKLVPMDKEHEGKFVVCHELGTHGAVMVWRKEYGVFDSKEEAKKAITYEWEDISQVGDYSGNGKMYPYMEKE